MMFRTHFAIGILIGLLLITALEVSYPVIFILIIAFSTALPDIDHQKSKLGRKIPFVSIPINLIFHHRKFFHSLFIPVILLLIFIYFKLAYFGIAIVIGYVAHLFADSVTREGVEFLYPISKRKLKGPLSTGGLAEKVLYMAVIIVDILITARLFNLFQ